MDFVSVTKTLNLKTLNKFIKKDICFYNLFEVRGHEARKNYLRGRDGEKVKNHCFIWYC